MIVGSVIAAVEETTGVTSMAIFHPRSFWLAKPSSTALLLVVLFLSVPNYLFAQSAGQIRIKNNTDEKLTIEIGGYYIDEDGKEIYGGGSWTSNPRKDTSLFDDDKPFRVREFHYRVTTQHGTVPMPGKVWVAKYTSGPFLDITINPDELPKQKLPTGRMVLPTKPSGEVPDSEAYIVDSSARDLPKQTNMNVEITATIKFKKPGTYYVVLGFTKEGKWLRGVFTGNEFWEVHTVTMGADDVRVFRGTPPGPPVGSKYWSVGVYRSLSDMQKYR